METVHISAGTKKYPVFIGNGVLQTLAPFIKERFPETTTIFIITDQTVGNLYLTECEQVLAEFPTISKLVPNGEEAKTFHVYYECLTFALENNLDRKSLILSLGGGAVGDLAGFLLPLLCVEYHLSRYRQRFWHMTALWEERLPSIIRKVKT